MLAVAGSEARAALACMEEAEIAAMGEEERKAAAHVIDLDAPSNDCPACGTTFEGHPARCPGCGLRLR